MSVNIDAGLYYYKAELVKVVDGDTVDLVVSLGFYVTMQRRFRLLGINSPETNASDPTVRQAATAAKLALEGFVSGASQEGRLRGRTVKDSADKYGRYLVVLLVVDTTGAVILDVNAAMIAGGYAVPYLP